MVLAQWCHLEGSNERWHQSFFIMKKLVCPTRNEAVQELWVYQVLLNTIPRIKEHANSYVLFVVLVCTSTLFCPWQQTLTTLLHHGDLSMPRLVSSLYHFPNFMSTCFCKAKLQISLLVYLVLKHPFLFLTLPKRPRSGRRGTFEPILLWTQCIVKQHLGFPLQSKRPTCRLFFCFLLGCRRLSSPNTDLTSTSKYSRAWEFLFTFFCCHSILWTCLPLESQEAWHWWEWRQGCSPWKKCVE